MKTWYKRRRFYTSQIKKKLFSKKNYESLSQNIIMKIKIPNN